MKIKILASGSKGNTTYIETSKLKILIDLGVSVRYINEQLKDLKTSIDDIDYVLITHLHFDHTKTLQNLSPNKKLKICVTQKMAKNLIKTADLNYLIYEDELVFDDLKISIIKTSHDSIDSRGFIIEEEESSLVYITDTGYLNQKYFDFIKDKNLYIMESNHDIEMLRNGKYPLYLQRRILGDRGHLSNELSATYLSKLIGPKTKQVVLAHLSEENNCEEVALKTFQKKMAENNIEFINVSCAKQNESSELINI